MSPAASLARMDSEGWDRRYQGRDLVWTSEANRFLIQEAAGLPPGRALDLACGEGRNAIWLAERGWTVTGVDFSKVGLGRRPDSWRTRAAFTPSGSPPTSSTIAPSRRRSIS